MLIEKPTGEIRTAYDNDNEPYLFEAMGKEAKHFCDVLRAEDDGRLVILPCKVGDTLYEPTDRKTISEYKVKAIRVKLFSVWIEWNIVSGFVYRSLYGVEASEIGKTVFLTREEAEVALNGGQDDGTE